MYLGQFQVHKKPSILRYFTGLGIGLALVSAAAGCRPPWAEEAAKPPPESTRLWSVSGPRPVGPVLNAQGVAIGTAAFNNDLVVLAFDPQSGKELWRRTASTGDDDLIAGAGMPGSFGKYLAFLSPSKKYPTSQGKARLVLVDPKSGKEKFSTPEMFIAPNFANCPGTSNICVSVKKNLGEEGERYEFNLTTGKFAPASASGYPKGARTHAGGLAGLYSIEKNGDVEFGWIVDGKTLWKSPSKIYAGKVAGDWQSVVYQSETNESQMIFNFSSWPEVTKGSVATPITGRYNSVQVEKKTGKVLWRMADTVFDCLNSSAQLSSDTKGPKVSLRCRLSGVVKRTYRGKAVLDVMTGETRESVTNDYRNVNIVAEGYDPLTGKTLWSMPVLNRDGLLDDTNSVYRPTVVSQESVLVQTKSGPTVLNLRTGEGKAAAPLATHWCRKDTSYSVAEPQYVTPDGKETTARFLHLGVDVLFSCGNDRAPSTQIPNGPVTAAAGVPFGDISVVALKDRFVGYQVR